MDEELSWLCEDPEAPLLNGRDISMRCFEDPEGLEVVGRLTDRRFGADKELWDRGVIHDMELRLKVARGSYTITAVKATMFSHPHEDCADIESAFDQLIGLSIVRGYTRQVQELLGRERGCSHLEFLARAVGPVVIQAITSLAARERLAAGGAATTSPSPFVLGSCHIWAEDGPAQVKLSLGWKPGTVFPVPRVEAWREAAALEEGS